MELFWWRKSHIHRHAGRSSRAQSISPLKHASPPGLVLQQAELPHREAETPQKEEPGLEAGF